MAQLSLATLLFLLVASHVRGQAHTIGNRTDQACTGVLLDSGGQGASGYGNNESFTYTLCPDQPGGAISLSFITFNLSTAGAAPIDFMTIYDGNNTSAPVLGTWTGGALQGSTISAGPGNPTGCLTVVFKSNNTGTGVFAATVSCYEPCNRPTAVAGHGAAGVLKICPGESVNFNGSASHAAPGFTIAQRTWDFGDGTVLANAPAVVSHTYTQPGAYIAQLHLIDNNGCASTNLVDLEVWAGTTPSFGGTTGAIGCSGETLCLNGAVQGTTWSAIPAVDLGGGIFLPDNVGECFSSQLTFTHFAAGQTLTSVDQLLALCVNMEHSFMGDLVIRLIGPTGQSVILHQQGGGGTYLGIPVDNESQPNVQGICWNYCWSPGATNGTWVANAGGTLPAGTYASVQPFSNLLGSPLNGTWTLEVCDQWSIDNGFICDWGLTFDPALYPDLTDFTPVYGAGCDSSFWAGPSIVSQGADCNQACTTGLPPGNHNFVYTVKDDFGCTYDTTVTVTIVPDLVVDAGSDANTCGTPVQLGATASGGNGLLTCDYVLWLYDAYGDGWNSNGYLTVTVDGVSTSWTLVNGSAGYTTIPVHDGSSIVLTYFRGTPFAYEQSFTLLNSSGNAVFTGNNPPNGDVWSGTAVCPGQWIYSWSPATGLSNPNIANPVATVATTTEYCVTVSLVGHPECTATDCMTITVDTPPDPGTASTVNVCANGTAINLFAELDGSPPPGGSWTDPAGAVHDGSFLPGTDLPGIYSYAVNMTGPCGTAVSTYTVTMVQVAPPSAGTNGSLALCSNGAAADLFAALGGTPDTGGSWSGPSAVSGGMFDPVTMAAGDYTYTVQGANPCANDAAVVSVVVNDPPDAGNDGSLALCSNGAAADLFAALGGTPDAGGTWSGPSTIVGGMFDPATMVAGDYTYTVQGANPCANDAAVVSVVVNDPPDAGNDASLALCSNGAAADLFAALGGTPDTGGSWSGPSAVSGGMFDPATMAAGDYTYTVQGANPCANDAAVVSVVVNDPPDAGNDASLALCSNGAPADLFAALGGTPDAGGTWSGPSTIVGGMFDPATMVAGDYTYTVQGANPCANDAAVVSVVVNDPPDAGNDASLALCSNGAPADLFAALGGTPDAGGTWSGPSTIVGGMFDPATMAAGDYTYTVQGANPCANDAAVVSVVVNDPPDAGNDGSLALCSNGAAADLFAALGGTPDAGGTWSGPSAIVGGMFDPATMAAGDYTYTVQGAAPCPADAAVVSVAVVAAPDAGQPGTITLCQSDAPVALFPLLGGTPDAGGTWTGPSAVAGGLFDPATMAAGLYTYTISVPPPCMDASATVQVNITTPPSAGTDGAVTLCISSPPADLFAALGGTPDAGGTWSGPSAIVGGMFDPATMAAGDYTYTVQGAAPCPADAAVVSVAVVAAPDAGQPGTITLCQSDAPVALFPLLGGTPDAGGAWTGPSAVAGGLFDPATMAAGLYTYTISVPPPCVDASATVLVNITTPPSAGTDGAVTLCISSPPADLFAALGGTPDAGGTWSGPSTIVGGMFDPATMAAGDYTYTVQGAAPCPADAAVVSVAVVAAPDAGQPGTITLCQSDAPVALFPLLGGTPDAGGTWTGPSAVAGGLFDPATMAAGLYTYTISVPPPCVDASATVLVNITTPPSAGTDGAVTLCISSPPADLFAALGGTPDAGGTWSGPSTIVGGMFDPATMAAGDYTYTVQGAAPCPADAAVVSVAVVAAPDAGQPGTITLCQSDAPVALFPLLGGTPDAGGTWTGPSAVTGGLFDPATMAAGLYTYTISVPPPCLDASATVLVNITTPPSAGTDGAITLCISSPPADLFAALGGTPDAGGTWSGPSAIVGGMFDPATMAAGDYTYTVQGAAPCPADAAVVSVAVVAAPDAGQPGTITLCQSDAPVALFPLLGGTPDAGGAWTGPSAVAGGLFDPATMAAGLYTYTISVPPPCLDASATVQVNITTPPSAGTDGAITLCISSPPADLFAALGGTPDAGGSWSGPSTIVGGMFDPATMAAGDYTYTVQGAAPCPADAAVVSVAVVAAPDAGQPGTITLCQSDAPVALFPLLGGTPDAGGTWTGPSAVTGGLFDPATMAAGLYTYTISVPPPCLDASATVLVNITTPPSAGTDGAVTLCISSPPADLFAALGGTPDAGGTWSGPSAIVGSMFDPATMAAGDYTYTVQGAAPCPADAAVVSVAVVAAPDAGPGGELNLCASGDPMELFSALPAAGTGGAWTGPMGMSPGGIFIPGTSPAGTYTYTIPGSGPCPASAADLLVHVITDANAGLDALVTTCSSADAINLWAQLQGSPNSGGHWTGPDGATATGLFTPGTSLPGTYRYVVSVPPPCVNDTALVTVDVVQAPDAGESAAIELCSSDAAIGLVSALGGTPDEVGTWTGPNGLSSAAFYPGIDPPGSYVYTVAGTAPCPDASATLLIVVHALPSAGEDGSLSLCPEAGSADLFAVLGGAPDAGGTWTQPGGGAHSGLFDPASNVPGVYTYTVTGTPPCPNDQATALVQVHVVPAPDAGPDAVSCGYSTELNATGTWASGTWSTASNASIADPASANTAITVQAGGAYHFLWSTTSAEGCASADSVTIIFTDPIIIGLEITHATCHGACNGAATAWASGGNALPGAWSYAWQSVSGISPATIGYCAGDYLVTALDTNGCSATVPFTIEQPAPLVINGLEALNTLCATSCDGSILVTDPAGTAFRLDNGPVQEDNSFGGLCAGLYTITMFDAQGCSAQAQVSIANPPPVVARFTFTPDTLGMNSPIAQFDNISSANAMHSLWEFGDGGTSTAFSPSYQFPFGMEAEYEVCLTASTINGCSDTYCLPIPVTGLPGIYVPNAFTPDGDGRNDMFRIAGNKISAGDFELLIFDRWGERVFHATDPADGWDGRHAGGEAKSDVYVWKICFRFQGNVERHEMMGHVTLLR